MRLSGNAILPGGRPFSHPLPPPSPYPPSRGRRIRGGSWVGVLGRPLRDVLALRAHGAFFCWKEDAFVVSPGKSLLRAPLRDALALRMGAVLERGAGFQRAGDDERARLRAVSRPRPSRPRLRGPSRVLVPNGHDFAVPFASSSVTPTTSRFRSRPRPSRPRLRGPFRVLVPHGPPSFEHQKSPCARSAKASPNGPPSTQPSELPPCPLSSGERMRRAGGVWREASPWGRSPETKKAIRPTKPWPRSSQAN